MKIPLLISRLILGGVFVYASFDKILHPHEFAEVVYNYQILPDALVNLTAILLPWLELCAGVFLILGLFLRGALFTCNMLLAVFLVALAFNLARGLDIDCGCFSSSVGPSTGGSMILYLLRDAFLLAMGLSVFFYVLRRENPGALPEDGAEKTSM
jgi:cobalt-zinc-cadmium efflux system protein